MRFLLEKPWAIYCRAYNSGKKTVRKLLRKGADPYLKALSKFLTDDMIAQKLTLGIMEIPVDKIVGIGSAEDREQFSFDFMPLAAPDGEDATKWCKLYWHYLSNQGARTPITCYEYMGEFYICDGKKRVSIAKCHGVPTITASVTRILPVQTEDEAVQRYYDFLKCFELTGLYQICFSKPGCFVDFQKALGHDPDYAWTDEDRMDFLFNWHIFEHAFEEAFNGYLTITSADALMVLLEEYPYEKLRDMPAMVLIHIMRKAWAKLYAIQNSEFERVVS